MALTAYTLCTIYARQVTTLSLSVPVEVINAGNKQSYTSGASAFQVSQVYYYSGSLAPSTGATFNLGNSSLTDNFGQSIQFSTLNFVLFNCLSTKAATLGWIATVSPLTKNLLGYTAQGPVMLPAQAQVFLSAPRGANCGSILWIRNSAAGTLSYNFVVVGS